MIEFRDETMFDPINCTEEEEEEIKKRLQITARWHWWSSPKHSENNTVKMDCSMCPTCRDEHSSVVCYNCNLCCMLTRGQATRTLTQYSERFHSKSEKFCTFTITRKMKSWNRSTMSMPGRENRLIDVEWKPHKQASKQRQVESEQTTGYHCTKFETDFLFRTSWTHFLWAPRIDWKSTESAMHCCQS